MKYPKPRKAILAVFMAFLMSNMPNILLASSSKNEMISAGMVLAEITRAEAEKNIIEYLQKSEVQSELIRQGIPPDEALARLSILNEQEIRQLSGQVYEARAGGDILVAILLVVLIIYFAKRI